MHVHTHIQFMVILRKFCKGGIHNLGMSVM
jgi:hypothetical protein